MHISESIVYAIQPLHPANSNYFGIWFRIDFNVYCILMCNQKIKFDIFVCGSINQNRMEREDIKGTIVLG